MLWWWLASESFAHRSPRLGIAWQGFFYFMVYKGTIVLGTGPVRWLGALICAGLAGLWWCKRIASDQ